MFAGLFLATPAMNAYGHHSVVGNYDRSRTVEIKGVLVDFRIRSPHSSLTVDVTNKDGVVERWGIETRSLPQMRRRGWDKDTLTKGDVITVYAWPNVNPDKTLVFAKGFITEDGKIVGDTGEENESGVELADGSVDPELAGVARLAGRWITQSREGDFAMPLTPAGIMASDNFDPKKSPATTCEPVNLPAIYYTPYLHDIRFNDDEVIIYHEVYAVTRTIQMDAEPKLVEESGIFGVATGRIEGDELVIESSDFPSSGWGLAMAGIKGEVDIPSSVNKRMTERISVSKDGQTLSIDFTLEDSVYLSEPFLGHAEFRRVSDEEEILSYDCGVESASRFTTE